MELKMQIDDRPQYGVGDASYQAAGGEAGIRKLVNAFYDAMERLPEAAKIRKMHPADLTVSRDKLTLFLCGWGLLGIRVNFYHFFLVDEMMSEKGFATILFKYLFLNNLLYK